jgi:hypothetical protein
MNMNMNMKLHGRCRWQWQWQLMVMVMVDTSILVFISELRAGAASFRPCVFLYLRLQVAIAHEHLEIANCPAPFSLRPVTFIPPKSTDHCHLHININISKLPIA